MRKFSVYIFKYVVAAVVGCAMSEEVDSPYMGALGGVMSPALWNLLTFAW